MTQSRSAERFRLARLAVTFGGFESLIVGAALATRLALLVWGLGRRDYGLYMAVLGLVATANSLDFGLHYGVTNLVSAARGRDDEASVRRTIATAFMTYAAVSLAAFCVVLILVARAPIGWLLSIEPAEVHVARLVAVLGFASMLLPMPLKVFGAGMAGYQEQHAVSVYRSLNSLIQLGMLSLTIVAFRGKLPAIASVACVTDLSLWSLFALWIVRHRPLLALHLPSASRMQVLPLLGMGLTFFITSMAILLKGAIGNTIIAHGLGPEGVGPFSVPLALFSTANTLAALSAVSLWPAFGEAAARGDWTWVGKAFVLGAKACLGIAGLFAVLGSLFGEDVVNLLAPKAGQPSRVLLLTLGAWLLTQAAVNVGSVLLWGLNRNRIVMCAAVGEGLLSFTASSLVVHSHGREGVAVAMAVSGILAASFLLLYATPTGSGGRIQPPFGPLARVAACTLAAALVGAALNRALAASAPLPQLVFGAMPTALVYVVIAWSLILNSEERMRLWGWILRGLRTIFRWTAGLTVTQGTSSAESDE